MDSSVALAMVSVGSPVMGTMNILLSIMLGSKDALKPWDSTLVSRAQCPVCSPAKLDQQEGTPYQICVLEALARTPVSGHQT